MQITSTTSTEPVESVCHKLLGSEVSGEQNIGEETEKSMQGEPAVDSVRESGELLKVDLSHIVKVPSEFMTVILEGSNSQKEMNDPSRPDIVILDDD